MNKNLIKPILGFFYLLVILFASTKTYGQRSESFYNSIKGTAIIANASFIVKDDKFNSSALANVDTTYRLQNTVTFELNEDTVLYPKRNFTCSIDLKVKKWDANNNVLSTVFPTLTINYDTTKTQKFTRSATYRFNAGDKVQVTVQAINYSAGGVTTPPAIFLLSGKVDIDRSYKFDCTEETHASDSTYSSTREIEISWTKITGANYYDVEWTFYDDSSFFVKNFASLTNFDSLFLNNSSRVTTALTTYRTSCIYPKGVLFYRVRGVRQLPGKIIQNGKWTFDLTDTCKIGWSADTLYNWQMAVSYAEEGKKKEILSYFDGSMHKKQTVTRMNSDVAAGAIVLETLYDNEGRPAVDVLPVPTGINTLKYFNNLNMVKRSGGSLVAFTKDTFDIGDCSYMIPPMDSSAGVANYYSMSNTNRNTSYDRFLPNSYGYPYAVRQYTTDNTGRLSRQSGVGKDLRLNNGHDTRYYYGQAEQDELDRLFGVDVGDASHYQKEMIIDPNNQVSVSYKDAHGRVIATALAGPKPVNLDSLPETHNTDSITVNLLDYPIKNAPDISSTHVLLLSQPSYIKFTYKVTPPKFSFLNCSTQTVCFECLYDLKITVTDECGNILKTLTKDLKSNYPPANTNCTAATANVDTFSVSFSGAGAYHVSKSLVIDTGALKSYNADFLAQTTCKTFDDFLTEALLKIDLSGCNVTCASCLQTLGTRDSFLYKYTHNLISKGLTLTSEDTIQSNAIYDATASECDQLCHPENGCAGYLETMKIDISPGGQYGLIKEDPYGNITAGDNTSVCNNCTNCYNDTSLKYVDNDGTLSLIDYKGNLVRPNYVPADIFVANWRASWADTLVKKHPEYCYYLFCISDTASARYDYEMQEVETYAEALAKGFLNPLNKTTSSIPYYEDPFFKSAGAGHSYKNSLGDLLDSYAPDTCVSCPGVGLCNWNAWEISTFAAGQITSCASTGSTDTNTLCKGDQNIMWQTFRAIYLSEKSKYHQIVENAYVTANSCCNSNIGIHNSNVASILGTSPCSSPYSGSDYGLKNPVFTSLAPTSSFNSGMSNPTTATATVGAELTQSCDTFCIMHVKNWMTALSGCYDSTLYYSIMYARLVSVCQGGCDSNHPMGSSSMPPGTFTSLTIAGITYHDTSFAQVIYFYIADTDSICNPYALELPPAYEDSSYFGTAPLTDSVPPCLCEKLQGYKIEFDDAADTTGLGGFSGYLKKRYQIDMTNEDLTILLDKCTDPGACFHLDHPIEIPDALACVHCITCTDIQIAMSDFEIEYDSDINHFEGQTLLTHYLNAHLHLNMTWQGYSDFMKNCGTRFNFCDTVQAIIDLRNATVKEDVPLNLFIESYLGYIIPDFEEAGHVFRACFSDFGSPPFWSPALTCTAISKGYNLFLIDKSNKGQSFSVDSIAGFLYSAWFDNGPFTKALVKSALISCIPGIVKANNLLPRCDTLQKKVDTLFMNYTGLSNVIFLKDTIATLLHLNYFPFVDIQTITDSLIKCSVTQFHDTVDCWQINEGWQAYIGSKSDSSAGWWLNQYFGWNKTTSQYMDWVRHCRSYTLCNQSYFPPLPADTSSCLQEMMALASNIAADNYRIYKDSLKGAFFNSYMTICMSAVDTFTCREPVNEYHYTLYYYDQADNLIKTVPPKGVALLSNSYRDSLKTLRDAKGDLLSHLTWVPSHTFITRYYYNSLNKVVKQYTPDADTARFWYDKLLRIVASQNAKQKPDSGYSYSTYDELGRITQAGYLKLPSGSTNFMTHSLANDSANFVTWINNGTKKEVTQTFYETQPLYYTPPVVAGLTQRNMHGRIFKTIYQDTYNVSDTVYNYASHYNYDVEGNVSTLVQENRDLRSIGRNFKRIDYDFDLISGKVNKVMFQKDSTDQFIHQYQYDADNRITNVLTTTDGITWENEASYFYYKHGPLARVELGQRQVQGIDYAYTLQGWIKGVNSSYQLDSRDMGSDSYVFSGKHKYFGKDAYGYTLGYYQNDYKRITDISPTPPPKDFELTYVGTPFDTSSAQLFNGNIRHAVYGFPTLAIQEIGYAYTYDQLNRLVKMDMWKDANLASTNYFWKSTATAQSDYKERITYDPDGNILQYLRNGQSSQLKMDSLKYSYYANTNRLEYVHDSVGSSNYTGKIDIDNQSAGNYTYDAIGNLVGDVSEGLTVWWNNYGKIDSIRNTKDTTALRFRYDPMGNRIEKRYYKLASDSTKYTDFYVRDAQGNIMSNYRQTAKGNSSLDSLRLTEVSLYGSSRLGVYSVDTLLYVNASGTIGAKKDTVQFIEGKKQYELSNHLGNVLVTISDRKLPIDDDNDTIVDWYSAINLTVQDYYPFGMVMPNRSYSAGTYLYAFNTQEKDDEISGSGNHYTAQYWEYDPRTGRRWNLDPVDQVSISNYAVNGLNPILYSDPDGDLFGIKGFGSTSEQRKAARKYAKEHNGEVNNLLRKSINVTYAKYESLPIAHDKTDVAFSGGITLTEKTQYFNSDGSLYDDRPSIRTYEPSLMDNWRDNHSFTYGIANSIYTAPQLFTQPFTGGWYSLDGTEQVRGSNELIGNFVMGASTVVPVGATKYAMGPMKNWIRLGESYSVKGGFETYSLRWGAGGKHWKKIPSTTLQNINKSFRQTKIPLNNWRTIDPGHFHFKKIKP